jgi:hypothetical protein
MDDNGLPNDCAAVRQQSKGVRKVRDGRGKPRRDGGELGEPTMGVGQKEDQA